MLFYLFLHSAKYPVYRWLLPTCWKVSLSGATVLWTPSRSRMEASSAHRLIWRWAWHSFNCTGSFPQSKARWHYARGSGWLLVSYWEKQTSWNALSVYFCHMVKFVDWQIFHCSLWFSWQTPAQSTVHWHLAVSLNFLSPCRQNCL